MNDTTRITVDDMEILVEPWAPGKVRLTSANADIQSVWLGMRDRHPGVVELLTDPDFEPCDEDLDGALSVIVDSDVLRIEYDLSDGSLIFAVHKEALHE